MKLFILKKLHSFTLFSDRVLSMVTHDRLTINQLLVKEWRLFVDQTWLNKVLTEIELLLRQGLVELHLQSHVVEGSSTTIIEEKVAYYILKSAKFPSFIRALRNSDI